MKKFEKGFTLIELLVVVAIIGILSSIVLVSLNSARQRGRDASLKGSLSSMRAAAEIVYDEANPNSYATVCTNGVASKDLFDAALDQNLTGANGCTSTATDWNAYIELNANNGADTFCVDSDGFAGIVSTTNPIAGGLCNPLP